MKRIFLFLIAIITIASSVSGCFKNSSLTDPDNPVTLTMWHVYGSQTKSPLNLSIDNFNKTTGREKGIIVNVVSVTSSSAIDKALSAAANDEPGAVALPDLFTAYPRVAELVGKKRLLAWDDYFSEKELSKYTDEFISEGYFEDRLLMLPFAKSSEVFYLNKTLFDKFSLETGINEESLRTFSGLFKAANAYYDWSGGVNFTQINDFYNYAYIGMKAYGDEFIKNGKLNLESEAFEKIWNPLAKCAIYGGICLNDGYAAARWKTAEVISNIGSTADILYQSDSVIFPDNRTESIRSISMPYPLFDGKAPASVHRGGGLFAVKSDDERKNHAAYIFAKWITDDKVNTDFVTSAGYLPVKDSAFKLLFETKNNIEDEKYRDLYDTVDEMFENYKLHALPLFTGASEVQKRFEENVKVVLKSLHVQYEKRVSSGENSASVLDELTKISLSELKKLSEK